MLVYSRSFHVFRSSSDATNGCACYIQQYVVRSNYYILEFIGLLIVQED